MYTCYDDAHNCNGGATLCALRHSTTIGGPGRIEKALRDLQDTGRAGKTLSNYSEAISVFCDWCVQRSYLADGPLKCIAPFDVTPQSKRRAMTSDDIRLLLASSPLHRSLLYEMALFSGLRANELRFLTADDLDLDR